MYQSNGIFSYRYNDINSNTNNCTGSFAAVLPRKRGSERKSGKPDFSARPAGLRRFWVYLGYTLPPA